MTQRVELSNLDRVLWPEAGFTKGQLVDYYRRVAPVLLPHIAGRALTLGRFPHGVHRHGFAQTECRGRPDWLATAPVRLRSGQVRRYCVVNDMESLLWVANQGTVELHTFPSAGDEATAVIFDLDPAPGTGMAECCRVALRLRTALAQLDLAAFPKTSGYFGLHVYVPLGAPHDYERTRAFARDLAGQLGAGGVTIDWRQNHPRRTTVAPYSLRAADIPTVSAPLTWEEVEAADPQRLVIVAGEVPDRIERFGDLWRPVLELEQSLPAG